MFDPLIYKQHFALPFSSEQRSYQVLKLPNGIHGLIITDPTEDLATCCLSIATGHHDNPDDISGLAHLCEHMITLSSKYHPEPEKYRKAVHQAGGTNNAMTNNEVTSYFYSIPVTPSNHNQSDFENILDIFTSNFANPTFDSSFSNREIYSVDNEHTFNKSKKNRLTFQGYKLLANRDHQFSRFSTGNFDSLTESCKKYDIRTRLLEFYQKEYKPDRMAFVLRGPQSLNYLQKLAITNFGKIGNSKGIKSLSTTKPKVVSTPSHLNILEATWKDKYHAVPYDENNLQRAVLINKDIDSLLRVAFPVSLQHMNCTNHRQVKFFIDYWCDLFGSEASNTISSALFSRDLISSITTKTSVVTYDTNLIELEIAPTENGLKSIAKILDIIFNFVSLFDIDTEKTSKFVKHLAKSMSQFNGIGIYNFLYAESQAQSVWEAKDLTVALLHDINANGQFFINSSTLYDFSVSGFQGAYAENDAAKEFWINEAKMFCKFMKNFVTIKKTLISYVGDLEKTSLDWLRDVPATFQTEKEFSFDFKIASIDPNVIKLDNGQNYKLNLSPPNEFADEIIENQTKLLKVVQGTIESSTNASLGYSVKNISLNDAPKLFHHDPGCQLWIKTEIDSMFRNKVLLTIELINTQIGASPKFVAALEILIQLVKYRVNEYLYPALTMQYSFDLFPSFKGDTGILLNVAGPREKFTKVLMALIYEMKLISGSFRSCVSLKEFERAKNAVLLKYSNGNHMSSLHTASLGLMATLEEDTWLLDDRINSCNGLTFDKVDAILPRLFNSCYLTALLQGDINGSILTNDILPIVAKLVTKFEGQNYFFPSSVLLPEGSNYYVSSTTKDATNGIEYFVQTCTRDNIVQRSITKFVTFLMGSGLTSKIRTEYQLGYIVLVGLRALRKTQGFHISVVSGSHTAEELDSKLDSLVIEWYEQNVKRLKQSQLDELIEKFLASESAANSSMSGMGGSSNLFFGALGASAGDKKTMKQHNGVWGQIENKSYLFSSNMHGDDFIDVDYIKQLSINTLNDFIKRKILPTSKQRSKVSVLINSSCTKENVERNLKAIQLYIFLTSMGLPIKQEQLDDILEKSGNSQVVLCKNLYKFYREKGKSITLIAAVMAKLSKSLLFSATDSAMKVEPAVARTEVDINHLRDWQVKVGYYREKSSLVERLSKFK